jgi:hypothetical protein
MENLRDELPTSAPLPAGQTKPVKIPNGSKVMFTIKNYTENMSGSIIFNDLNNHYEINYEELPKEIENLDFPCETGCFFNNSTGIEGAIVFVNAIIQPNMVYKSLLIENPEVSQPLPAGQTKPVKIPGGKKIKIIEEPTGTVGQLLLHHVEPPEIIDYPRLGPTDTVYNFVNDICLMTNVSLPGTYITVLAVD